jgi:hypothetical protein
VGALKPALAAQVQVLPVGVLEQLGEDLLDFSAPADLENWLAGHASTGAETA